MMMMMTMMTTMMMMMMMIKIMTLIIIMMMTTIMMVMMRMMMVNDEEAEDVAKNLVDNRILRETASQHCPYPIRALKTQQTRLSQCKALGNTSALHKLERMSNSYQQCSHDQLRPELSDRMTKLQSFASNRT